MNTNGSRYYIVVLVKYIVCLMDVHACLILCSEVCNFTLCEALLGYWVGIEDVYVCNTQAVLSILRVNLLMYQSYTIWRNCFLEFILAIKCILHVF